MAPPFDEEAGPQWVGPPSSLEVSWWPTHLFISALVDRANYLPYAGTPAWCALPDSDPNKLLALAVAGEHHVLRMEAAQEAMAQASRDISAAANWTAIANANRRRAEAMRTGAYIPRRSA